MRLLVWTAWGLVACTGVTQDDEPVNISDIDMDGFSSAQGDCDDQNPDVYPGNPNDVVGDGIDFNCDQSDGIDNDGDGDPSQGSGGGDCNDEDETISSEAEEIGWDGIDQDCDGEDQYDFDDICGGDRFTCGVSTIGEIHCWGTDSDLIISGRPLDGQFVQIDCGDEFACARQYDGSVACWGDNTDDKVEGVPSVAAQAVFVGPDHACIIRQADGRPECWGNPEGFEGVGGITAELGDMALGQDYSCGTTNVLGFIDCFGMSPPAQGSTIFENGDWIKTSGGDRFICGIDRKQNLRCLSDEQLTTGELREPSQGPYSWLDVNDDWACAIKEASELSCWGSSNNPVTDFSAYPLPLNNLDYVRVGVGFQHGCVLRADTLEPVCWGVDVAGETEVPDFAGYAGN